MPNEFTVVGEKRDDESQLLVMGSDGLYYGYSPAREQFLLVEPDEQWTVYVSIEDELSALAADVIDAEPVPRAAAPEE